MDPFLTLKSCRVCSFGCSIRAHIALDELPTPPPQPRCGSAWPASRCCFPQRSQPVAAGGPIAVVRSASRLLLPPNQPHKLAHPRPHALACSQSPLSRASNLARVSCRLSALRCSAPAAPPLPPPPPPPPLSPAPGRRPNSSVIGRAAPTPRWLSACCETDNAVVVCKPSPTLNLFVPSLSW
jgi:hypothetical protein